MMAQNPRQSRVFAFVFEGVMKPSKEVARGGRPDAQTAAQSVEKIVDCLGKRNHSEANSQLAKNQPILVCLSSSLFSKGNPRIWRRWRRCAGASAHKGNFGGFPQSAVKIY
jgi:hypothetical protein